MTIAASKLGQQCGFGYRAYFTCRDHSFYFSKSLMRLEKSDGTQKRIPNSLPQTNSNQPYGFHDITSEVVARQLARDISDEISTFEESYRKIMTKCGCSLCNMTIHTSTIRTKPLKSKWTVEYQKDVVSYYDTNSVFNPYIPAQIDEFNALQEKKETQKQLSVFRSKWVPTSMIDDMEKLNTTDNEEK